MSKLTKSKIGKLMALLLSLAAFNLESVAAVANFPVGTHLIKGTLKDWKNKVLTSSTPVTIQAVSTTGSVIASTEVADPTVEGYNFLLQIPLSTTATDSTAAVGDELNCVLIQESGLSIAAKPLTVGEANTVNSVNLAFVNMREFTSTETGETVSVPQEYIDTIAPWMEAYEKGDTYDPFADYDDDGVKNYAEYCSGTNPFDDADKLTITAYSAPLNATHTLSFEYVGGHVYGVATTTSLTNPAWATQPVMTTENGATQDQVMPSAEDDDVGVATVYVVPAEGATSQFFRVEPK